MTTKHDWTKLTNGWARYSCAGVAFIGKCGVEVHDNGELLESARVRDSGVGTPERTLELLTEAVAQRKQCEVREPRLKFGDWVKTPLGSRHRVVDVRRGGVCYTLPLGGMSLYAYDESALTPCDPPGDGVGV